MTNASIPTGKPSGPRHCRYDRPGHLHTSQTLSSPPSSAWNEPPDHPSKNFFRCAGDRCESASRRRLCFRQGGRAAKARMFVQKALLAELVPQSSIAPCSSRAGRSCACFLCPGGPPLSSFAFAGLVLPHQCARCPSLLSCLLHRHARSCSPCLAQRQSLATPCMQESKRAFRRGAELSGKRGFLHRKCVQQCAKRIFFLRLAPVGARSTVQMLTWPDPIPKC